MQRFAAALKGDGTATWKADPPTPHDLRGTVATRLSSMGFPREDRKAVLGHVEGDVHGAHYDLYDRATEKRRMLNAWAESLSAFVTGRAAHLNVIPVAARRS